MRPMISSIAMTLCALSLNAQDGFLTPTRLVRTAQGLVLGVSNGRVDQFLGIPYAAPPLDDLRWKPPVEAPKWPGVRDAIEHGNECTQAGGGQSVGMASC